MNARWGRKVEEKRDIEEHVQKTDFLHSIEVTVLDCVVLVRLFADGCESGNFSAPGTVLCLRLGPVV